MNDTHRRPRAASPLLGAFLLTAVALAGAGAAHAIELIPSIGVTKSTDANAGDARAFGGLALRAPLLPFLKVEGGIGYRQDSYANGDLKVRQWPVTASAGTGPVRRNAAGIF